MTALAGGLLSCVALLVGAPAASAAVAVTVFPTLPGSVQVGDTVPATLTITNQNNGGDVTSSQSLVAATLVPNCGVLIGGPNCLPPFLDPDVLVPSDEAVGAQGSACASVQFELTQNPLEPGKSSFIPQTAVALPGPGSPGPHSCVIAFTLGVAQMPTMDANGGGAGQVTAQIAAAEVTPMGGGGNVTGSGNGTTVVIKGAPDLTTQVAPASIAPGGSFTDTATLGVSDVGLAPTGTVTFGLFGPDNATCAGPPSPTSTVGLTDNGTKAVSVPFSPAAVGTYRLIASYGGDRNYEAISTTCNDPGETVVVAVQTTPPPPPAPLPLPPPPGPPVPPPPVSAPVVTILASPDVAFGGIIAAGASVGGRVSPTSAATVLFRLFGPDDPTCTRAPVFVSTSALSPAGGAVSAGSTPALPGSYRWIASYSGDVSNGPAASSCADPAADVTVAPGALIEAVGFSTPPRVGRSTNLLVRASDPTQQISGMQVQFGEARGLVGVSACRVPVLGQSLAPVTLSVPRVFRTSGAHTVVVEVLSGDCTGALRRSVRTIVVDVASATTRQALRGARGAATTSARAAAAASSCRDRSLRPTSAATRRRVATALLCLVNGERRKRGLRALLRSPRLQRAANAHAGDLTRRRYFEHAREPGTLAARLRTAAYRGPTYAENIGYGSDFTATLMVAAWMRSAPQRTNILHRRLRYAGVGVSPALPVAPQRPGSTYTLDLGNTLR